MSLIAAIAVLCAPETKDKKMPRDVTDFDSGPVYKFLINSVKKKKMTKQEQNENT